VAVELKLAGVPSTICLVKEISVMVGLGLTISIVTVASLDTAPLLSAMV
jgi:hypothetical protein